MNPRVLAALAVADFRDRARRPVFVVAVLAAVGLGYLAAPPAGAEYTIVKIGSFRGTYDSSYLGTILALATAVWVSFIGFYVVKNAIARDTATRVGEILAATPMRRAEYTVGKFLSNLLVLVSITVGVAMAALVTLLVRGESDRTDLVGLWLPFPLLAIPALAAVASAAVLFETVPLLRGGLGNVLWPGFFWLLIGVAVRMGFAVSVPQSMAADLRAQHPQANTEFSVGMTLEKGGLDRFDWSGLEVTVAMVISALGVLLLAVLLASLPALWFSRFDATRDHRPADGADRVSADGVSAGRVGSPATATFAGAARPRTAIRHGLAFPAQVAGELRLLVKDGSRWWWLGVLAITAAALAVPVEIAAMLLPAAWLWPVLRWSRLGTRRYEHDVYLLTTAGPAPLRQLLAEWVAGTMLAGLTGVGPMARMLLAGDGSALAAWLAGAVFIPALAVLLGSLSRSSRPFQVVYLIAWYTMVSGAPAADFMGVNPGAGPGPLLVLGAGAAMLGAALVNQGTRHTRR